MTETANPTEPRRLEYLPLADLKLDPKNPRAHSGEEVLDQSIGRFGYVEAVVRDDRTGFLISGHGRTKRLVAMEQAGESPPEGIKVDADGRWLVPTVVGWASRTDSEAAAALIALNRTTELGGWVDDALLDLLDDLAEMEDGFAGVGFDQDALDDLRAVLDEQPSDDSFLDDLSDTSDRSSPDPVMEVRCPECSHLFEV